MRIPYRVQREAKHESEGASLLVPEEKAIEHSIWSVFAPKPTAGDYMSPAAVEISREALCVLRCRWYNGTCWVYCYTATGWVQVLCEWPAAPEEAVQLAAHIAFGAFEPDEA